MNYPSSDVEATSEIVQCPYCSKGTSIDVPEDYAPIYAYCRICSKKFIVERLLEGFRVSKREDAPYCCDPDCWEIEMGGSDEQ